MPVSVTMPRQGVSDNAPVQAMTALQIPPRDPTPIPVDDRLDHQPGIRELPTRPAGRPRQHRLDHRPLRIRNRDMHPDCQCTHPSICRTRLGVAATSREGQVENSAR